MARVELGGVSILAPEDTEKIKDNHTKNVDSLRTEREFARLLRDKTDLIINYEPFAFTYEDEEGNTLMTVPDFQVVNPRTGVETIIEITASKNGKGRQSRIMRLVEPDTHYVVIFRDQLARIQNKFADPVTGEPAYALIPNGIIVGNKPGK